MQLIPGLHDISSFTKTIFLNHSYLDTYWTTSKRQRTNHI